MHPSFLDLLACPATGEPLRLVADARLAERVIEGSLTTETGAHSYPIRNGVPRFCEPTSDGYAESFGYQWNRWKRIQFEAENLGTEMEGHTTAMWQRITGISGADLGGKVIADFGCGPGRFIDVARRKGARVVGLDLSSAVEAATKNFRSDPDVLICQADVLRPPLRQAALDGAFSIGVLHHTPDPSLGVRRMAESLRPGGWLAVHVYRKGGFYDSTKVQAYRRLAKALWPLFGPYPALGYAFFAAYALRPLFHVPALHILLKPFVVAVPQDRRWCLLDTFDAITPAYQSAHTGEEVRGWLTEAGLAGIVQSDWGATSWRARRPTAP